MSPGATRRDRIGDLLITKNIRSLQMLHSTHTELPDINNLGKLLSLKQQALRVAISKMMKGVEKRSEG